MPNRLHKSQTNRMIAGVCGGLAEYIDADPTVVRLLFVLLTLFHGLGIIAYIILWIVAPEQSSMDRAPGEVLRENLGRMREEVERLGTELRETSAGTAIAVAESTDGEGAAPAPDHASRNRQVISGTILVLLGVILLAENLSLFWWLSLGRLWPVALIALGLFLLYDRTRPRR